MQNLSSLFSNMRTRTILFATGGILLLVMIIGFLGFRSTTQQTKDSASVKTTSNIQSVPGLTAATPEYANVQSKLNEQNYQQAVKSQGSAIPTVIGKAKDTNGQSGMAFPGDDSASKGGSGSGSSSSAGGAAGANGQNGSQQAGAGKGQGTDGQSMNNLSKGELAQMLKKQNQQLDALQKQLQQAQSQEAQQQQQQISQAMEGQAQQLMASWSGSGAVAAQQYVEGTVAKTATTQGAGGSTSGAKGSGGANQSGSNGQNDQEPVVKAGDIMFAVLNTAVNSDEPGPVMATVVQGPYKGAKLIGSMQKTTALPGTNGPTRVVLNFTTMSIPNATNSLSINAVAIDPDTARTALASDVDHHYLERYGSLFASAFLEGYGSAIEQSGSTVTNTIFGGSTQTYSDLSGIEEVAAGLGQVGQEWGSQLGEVLNRPNTITVNAGIGLGILFLSDATLDQTTAPQQPTTVTTNSNTTATTTQASAQNTQGVAQTSTTVVQ